jgi:ribosomal protein S18 acetylase RimI-like enzyme
MELQIRSAINADRGAI